MRYIWAMLLHAESLTKSYRSGVGVTEVLRGVSCTLRAGETLALTGESGSGKSTLLHLIAGLDVPDGGRITVDGIDTTSLNDPARAELRRAVVGLIFQQFNLIPSLTVAQNIAFQARLADRFDPAWSDDLTARLGLTELRDHYPEQLSGGQQQRVAIGRTLAAKPPLILADEPTGNLDQTTGDAVFDLMKELVGETGAGLLVVTHSDRLAARLDRRMHLDAGRIA